MATGLASNYVPIKHDMSQVCVGILFRYSNVVLTNSILMITIDWKLCELNFIGFSISFELIIIKFAIGAF